jgi:multicomponent Na+:H+ antiporter subunit B
MTVIVKSSSRIMIPLILIVGINIVFHGQLTPGGGFQGGTIIAAALTLYAISFGLSTSSKKVGLVGGLKSAGLGIIDVCALTGVVFWSLTRLGFFMQNNGLFPLGTPGLIFSSGTIFLFGLGEALNVAFGFMHVILVYTVLMESGQKKGKSHD